MSASSAGFSWKWFLALASVNLAAIALNHIDDTDETYGYWEPLHYLLFGKGMQTWEYDPIFAIRSYAFVFPMYIIGNFLRQFDVDKITLFYALRGVIGLFSTYAQYCFIIAISKKYGGENVAAKRSLSGITAMFLILSPGVFFASTSFLPSAVSMSLTMLSLARWMEDDLPGSIFWGSVAVLATGWPFVGLIFLPLGLHMLVSTFNFGGISQVFKLCCIGLLIVVMILLPVTSIDFNYYREPTAPFVNILTYNTGNKGDELYGIEPISYYVKNLLLTTGLAFLLACLAPVMEIVQLAQSFLISSEKFPPNRMDSYIFTIYLSAALWLGVLFSRPHKEERFLYPAYPLLAFAAARSMLIILHSLKGFVIVALPISRDTKSSIGRHLQEFVHRLLVIVMLAIFTLRIFANIRNYYGYMATWRDLNHQLIHSSEYLSKAAAYPASLTKPLRSYEDSIRVCTGSEWHLFPTHFFLPNAATVFYIEDNFHGILPQHFEAINGTFRVPPLPNNGDNEEEINRYIGIDECHYIVSSKDAQEFANRLPTATNSGQSSHLYLSVISSRPVLNRDDTSINALLRAFYLPSYLQRFGTVSFKPYQVLKVVNGGQNAQLRSPTFSEYRRMPVKEPSEKGVGKSFLGSLFSSVGSRKMKVKDEMTKEQLAKKLGLAERKKLKYEQNDNAESSEL